MGGRLRVGHDRAHQPANEEAHEAHPRRRAALRRGFRVGSVWSTDNGSRRVTASILARTASRTESDSRRPVGIRRHLRRRLGRLDERAQPLASTRGHRVQPSPSGSSRPPGGLPRGHGLGRRRHGDTVARMDAATGAVVARIRGARSPSTAPSRTARCGSRCAAEQLVRSTRQRTPSSSAYRSARPVRRGRGVRRPLGAERRRRGRARVRTD